MLVHTIELTLWTCILSNFLALFLFLQPTRYSFSQLVLLELFIDSFAQLVQTICFYLYSITSACGLEL